MPPVFAMNRLPREAEEPQDRFARVAGVRAGWGGVMLVAFGDESADEKTERVFTVAALLGRQSEWNSLEVKWRDRLDGRIFHAADCEHCGRCSARRRRLLGHL